MYERDPVVNEYQHDKFRPREADALHTLRKVASLVKPIMRQRGWRVGILTEFWPPETNLLGLNWNKGQKICLRLRYPHDEKQFIPFEQVVDTMLHELCHIIHGPHDEPFHILWNQLRTELEQLMSKGYTGEGFLSAGNRLGGSRIPKHEIQRRARIAAEKRRTLNAGSGQRLGGAPIARGQDIRQVIADAAARRATITRGCASETDRSRGIVEETSKNGFLTKANDEDANEEAIMQAYIDLIQEEEREKYGENYIPVSKENPAGSQGYPPASSGKSKSPPPPIIPASTKPTSSSPLIDLTTPEPNPDSWTCEICTLINPTTHLCCDACATERPWSPSPPKSTSEPHPLSFSSSSSTSPKNPPKTTKTNPPKNHPSTSTSTTTLTPKNSIRSLAALGAQEAKASKPLGWLCHRCGNWMESEWWTCAGCGSMKLSS